MPPIRRTLKNVVKNYSDAQVKVREATSNDPWGPSSTLMSEVSDLTYNVVAFNEIMHMIWKRLNDDGKNWRHVYKGLVLLEYVIKTGSEKVAQQCKENFHAIKTLTSFQHIDIDNKDQGMNVRERSKQLVALLSDDDRLKNERAKAIKAKERFAQNSTGMGSGGHWQTGKIRLGRSTPDVSSTQTGHSDSFGNEFGYGYTSQSSGSIATDMENARPSSPGEEERQLQLALALSKEEHEEELKKHKSDQMKLQMALEQSKQSGANAQTDSLLDLSLSSTSAIQATSHSTDPWGMPISGDTPSHQPTRTHKDPWGTPIPAPPSSRPAAVTNPWGVQTTAPAVSRATPTLRATPSPQPSTVATSAVAVDPWGMPVSGTPARATPPAVAVTVADKHSDPWSLSTTTKSGGDKVFGDSVQLDAFGAPVAITSGNAHPSSSLDSEFDMLSTRSTSTEGSPSKSGNKAVVDEFDLLGGGGSSQDIWNMESLQQNLPEPSRRKSPEAFLGANAALVNLDQLVTSTPTRGNNPFATPALATNNPFQSMGGGQHVTMAQMAPGFSTQPTQSTILPVPLVPMNPAAKPQNTSYNPFL